MASSPAVVAKATTTSILGVEALTSTVRPINHSTLTTTLPSTKEELSRDEWNQMAVAQRHIKNSQSAAQVLEIVQQFLLQDQPHTHHHNYEPLIADAISKCGKFRNADAALTVFGRYAPRHSELCRARTISICGSYGTVSDCLALLHDGPCHSTGPYNSAIAACGRQKDWQSALWVLRELMPQHLLRSTKSTLTINTVLTSLCTCHRGAEALALLNEMEATWGVVPDRISYHTTLGALLGQGQLDMACDLVQTMVERGRTHPKVAPNQETYKRLAAYVSGRPHDKAWLRERLGNGWDGALADFRDWNLPKVGRGQKSAYWKIGEITSKEDMVIVGLTPNKNPSANGIRINFYRRAANGDTGLDQKLGYLLMINSKASSSGNNDDAASCSSQFLGQFVDESERGHGWAKVWLAVWFQLCLDAGIQPQTGRIQKPLLCLVLQHSFQMIPKDGGIACELSPGDEPGTVKLYSERRALEGAFSPLDLRHQHIQLSRVPSNPRGRPIHVNTSFESPGEAVLRKRVATILELERRWTMVEGVTPRDLRTILLGTAATTP